jgi:hypothetical protein
MGSLVFVLVVLLFILLLVLLSRVKSVQEEMRGMKGEVRETLSLLQAQERKERSEKLRGEIARRSGREPPGETLGIALLDSDVFRESTGDLSDVRIFDGSETEARLVPF